MPGSKRILPKTGSNAQTGSKIAAKTGSKTAAKTGSKTAAKTGSKTAAKTGSKTASKTGEKAGEKANTKRNTASSTSPESDNDDFVDSENEYVYQTGGDTDDDDTEPDSDSESIDIDPDDEEDTNGDDRYDPVDEIEELEDPDEGTDIDDEAEDEAEEPIDEEVEDIEGIEEDVGDEFAGESKTCHMKNLNKDFIVLDEDDSALYEKLDYRKIPDNERISDPVMTYYEMTRIIGTRAQQFNFGAPALVTGIEDLTPPRMAYVELMAHSTPYIVRRHMPNKTYEDWKISELEIIHEITDDFFVPENFDKSRAIMMASQNNSSTSRIEPTPESEIVTRTSKSKIIKKK